MNRVFISYSNDDRQIAERITEELKQSGVEVFDDHQLATGENLKSRLDHELRRATHVVVLLSPSYLSSNWARRELETATLWELRGGGSIVPVMVRYTDLPPLLRNRVFADLSRDPQAALAQVREAVTTVRDTHKETPTRRRTFIALAEVLLSLLASAVGVLPNFFTEAVKARAIDWELIGVVTSTVGGLTVLVAVILRFWSYRRNAPIVLVTNAVEQAYIQALETSPLNPFGLGEVNRG